MIRCLNCFFVTLLFYSSFLFANVEVIDLKASEILPGSALQKKLIRAFECYNSIAQKENEKKTVRYENKIEREVLNQLNKKNRCEIFREFLPRPKVGCIYFVSIRSYDFSYDRGYYRTYNDERAFFRFKEVVELATDSTMYVDFKKTEELLSDSYGRKFKLYDVLNFGTAEEMKPFIRQEVVAIHQPPELTRILSRNEYVEKLKKGEILESFETGNIKCPKCKGTGRYISNFKLANCRCYNGSVSGKTKYVVSW